MRLPTARDDWRRTAAVVADVHRRPIYVLTTVAVAAVALTAFVLPGNISLVVNIVVLGDAPLGARLTVLADLYPFFGFGAATSILLVVTALLVGANVSVLVRGYRSGNLGGVGGSATGATLATLGAGCAACGSALLAAFFSVSAVAGALAFLPFEGFEFLALALAVLAVSTFWSAEATREACAI